MGMSSAVVLSFALVMPSKVNSIWCTRPLRLQQPLVTLVPNPSTTSLVSISVTLTGSFANCSFRLFGPWLIPGRRSMLSGTELTANFRARSHALRGFQGMSSFAIGEAFLDVLVLALIQNQGWTTEHLPSGYSSNYDTWIVPEARSDPFADDPRQSRPRGASWRTDKWDRRGGTA